MTILLGIDPLGEPAVYGPTEEIQFGPVFAWDGGAARVGALVLRHVASVRLHVAEVDGVSYSYGYFTLRSASSEPDSETCAGCGEARSVRGFLCARCLLPGPGARRGRAQGRRPDMMW